MNPTNQTILLTIDVEDWFQVENFKKCIPFSSWPDCELRVEKNVHKLLDLLEDIAGCPVYGYRAPGFSISRDILSLVEEAGYLYDSSFNSFKLNKRYGQMELKPNHGNGILHKISESFYEVPISNLRIGEKVIPWGGGGYFRLIPLKLFKQGVQSILKKQGAYLFYMHPWEIDPEQPHVKGAPFFYRLRHYTNMGSAFSKLSAFLEGFKNYQYRTCHQYLLNHHKAKEANLLRQIQKGRGEAAS